MYSKLFYIMLISVKYLSTSDTGTYIFRLFLIILILLPCTNWSNLVLPILTAAMNSLAVMNLVERLADLVAARSFNCWRICCWVVTISTHCCSGIITKVIRSTSIVNTLTVKQTAFCRNAFQQVEMRVGHSHALLFAFKSLPLQTIKLLCFCSYALYSF